MTKASSFTCRWSRLTGQDQAITPNSLVTYTSTAGARKACSASSRQRSVTSIAVQNTALGGWIWAPVAIT